MIELLRFFVRLARLRQAPQDLPAALPLLLLCLAANVAIGVLGGAGYFGGAAPALLANAIDAGVVAGMTWLLLSVNNHPARLVQTLTALYGLGALFGVAMLAIDALAPASGASPLITLLMLTALVWAHVAAGHVLRHALDQSLAAGIALAVGISAVSFVLVGNLLPPPAAPAG